MSAASLWERLTGADRRQVLSRPQAEALADALTELADTITAAVDALAEYADLDTDTPRSEVSDAREAALSAVGELLYDLRNAGAR